LSGDAQSVGVMEGLGGNPIQDITFQNCKISSNKGLVISHARNLDLTGLTLEVKQGEAITKIDVH
jgi:hypothetical protein